MRLPPGFFLFGLFKMKVRKGLIAAAGRGTRFLPVVKAYPKELIAILDKPNIQYLVEELLGAGVNEIGIVCRPGEKAIERYFTPDKELRKYLKQNNKESYLESLRLIWQKAKLRFIPQPPSLPYGNASPVLAAEKFLANQPFIYMFGDDLILEKKPGDYLRYLLKFFRQYQPAVILGVQKVPWEEVNRYASIKYAKDRRYPYRAVAVLEKLAADQAPSNMVQFGRFVVSAKIFPVLKAQKISRGNELWFADAVNTLAQKDIVLAVPIKKGEWLTTGDPLRWLKVNLELALRNKQISGELRQFLTSICSK